MRTGDIHSKLNKEHDLQQKETTIMQQQGIIDQGILKLLQLNKLVNHQKALI